MQADIVAAFRSAQAVEKLF